MKKEDLYDLLKCYFEPALRTAVKKKATIGHLIKAMLQGRPFIELKLIYYRFSIYEELKLFLLSIGIIFFFGFILCYYAEEKLNTPAAFCLTFSILFLALPMASIISAFCEDENDDEDDDEFEELKR